MEDMALSTEDVLDAIAKQHAFAGLRVNPEITAHTADRWQITDAYDVDPDRTDGYRTWLLVTTSYTPGDTFRSTVSRCKHPGDGVPVLGEPHKSLAVSVAGPFSWGHLQRRHSEYVRKYHLDSPFVLAEHFQWATRAQ